MSSLSSWLPASRWVASPAFRLSRAATFRDVNRDFQSHILTNKATSASMFYMVLSCFTLAFYCK